MTPKEQALLLAQLKAKNAAAGATQPQNPWDAPAAPMPSPMPSPTPTPTPGLAATAPPMDEAAALAEKRRLLMEEMARRFGGGTDPAMQQAGPAGSENFISKLAGMFGG